MTFIVAESDRRRLNVRLAHPMYGEVLRATMLAATGATSRAIADDLGLGQRTVESYLQNAYDKLGLANRAELATTLRGRPP